MLRHMIRLSDSLAFVTSEKSGKLAQNFITNHSLTDYFDKRTVSVIFFFNLCHDNVNLIQIELPYPTQP